MPFALALFAVFAGCAPTEEEDASATSSDAITLAGRPVSPAECKAFVGKHPPTATPTLSTGRAVSNVFRACDVNSTAIFGTVDLSFANDLMRGTGRVPVAVVEKGKAPMGLARLYFVNYVSSDLGPYSEFIFLIDAAEADASSDAKVLEWKNPISTLLPAFDPQSRTYTHQLILPKEQKDAIAYGRELLGYDKRAGAVDVRVGNDQNSFAVSDENGASVVKGVVRPNKRLSGLLKATVQLGGAAFGELVTPSDIRMKLHPLTLNQPIEVSGLAFSRDPLDPAKVATSSSTFWWLPSMNAATADNLDLELGETSELGKKLKDAHFTPAAFVTADHLAMTVERL